MVHIPDFCLVVLMGPPAAGKSTFAAKCFRPSEVISLDQLRLMISDDAHDAGSGAAAAGLMYQIIAERLSRRLLTVIDTTGLTPGEHDKFFLIAKQHQADIRFIAFDIHKKICLARNALRSQPVPEDILIAYAKAMKDAINVCGQDKRYYPFTVFRSVEEVDRAVVERIPLECDARDLTGPFDIVGDIHGCREELEHLLVTLGYEMRPDADIADRLVWSHPEGRTMIFVGDFTDRGPDSPGVMQIVMNMVDAGTGLAVLGNHDEKFRRQLEGRHIQVGTALQGTLEQFDALPENVRDALFDRMRIFFNQLPVHLWLDHGKLVVAHAGLKEAFHGRVSSEIKSFALFGDVTGEKDKHGYPVRLDWAQDYAGSAVVVHGHVALAATRILNNVFSIDTGCAFGGNLTALRYPEIELVSVPSLANYYEWQGDPDTAPQVVRLRSH
jgi:predicted kinase